MEFTTPMTSHLDLRESYHVFAYLANRALSPSSLAQSLSSRFHNSMAMLEEEALRIALLSARFVRDQI